MSDLTPPHEKSPAGIEILHTNSGRGGPPIPKDRNGQPVHEVLRWAREHIDRAAWFRDMAVAEGFSPRDRAALFAASLVNCDAARDLILTASEDIGRSDDARKILVNLPHKEIVNQLRNADIHWYPLPWVDGSYQLAPSALEVDRGSASLGLGPKGPIRHREWAPPLGPDDPGGSSTISDGRAAYLQIDAGVHKVFDPSAGKQFLLVDVIREFLDALQAAFPQLAKLWGNEL